MHKQHFAKALACSCEHLGVIEFLAMYSKPWRLTHCGGMGACFEKCWITIPNIHPLWIIECYYGKGASYGRVKTTCHLQVKIM
jgi:hypothetical protein